MRNYAAKGYHGVFLRKPNEGVVITNFKIHEIGQNFVIRISCRGIYIKFYNWTIIF